MLNNNTLKHKLLPNLSYAIKNVYILLLSLPVRKEIIPVGLLKLRITPCRKASRRLKLGSGDGGQMKARSNPQALKKMKMRLKEGNDLSMDYMLGRGRITVSVSCSPGLHLLPGEERKRGTQCRASKDRIKPVQSCFSEEATVHLEKEFLVLDSQEDYGNKVQSSLHSIQPHDSIQHEGTSEHFLLNQSRKRFIYSRSNSELEAKLKTLCLLVYHVYNSVEKQQRS